MGSVQRPNLASCGKGGSTRCIGSSWAGAPIPISDTIHSRKESPSSEQGMVESEGRHGLSPGIQGCGFPKWWSGVPHAPYRMCLDNGARQDSEIANLGNGLGCVKQYPQN